MNKRRKQKYHNPYCILVLKALIGYEVRQSNRKPKVSISDIEDYVANFKPEYGAGYDTITSKTFAEHIRKLWSKREFDFSTSTLDKMCSLLISFEPINSWSDFLSIYNEHEGAEVAQELMDKPFDQYAISHPKEYEFVIASVDVIVGVKRAQKALFHKMKNSYLSKEDLHALHKEILQSDMNSIIKQKLTSWLLKIPYIRPMPGHISKSVTHPFTPHTQKSFLNWKHRLWLKITTLYYLRKQFVFYYFKKRRYCSLKTIKIVILIIFMILLYYKEDEINQYFFKMFFK